MPPADQIRQLSRKFIEETRESLETTVQRVLADALEGVADERDAAVRRAVAEATASHQAALAAEQTSAAGERVRAVQAARDELLREHEARVAAETEARSAVEAQHAAEARATAEGEARSAAEARLEAETKSRALAEEEARVAVEQRRGADVQARLASEALGAAEARLAVEVEGRSAAEVPPAATAGRPSELAYSERLVEAFRRLDEARSLTEVLGALADQVAAEAGRVAVLVVRGSQLRGYQLRGVPDTDVAAVQLPVEPGSVFGRTVSTGLPVSTSDVPAGPEGSPMGFLALPAGRVGLAVPIAVGGQVVAVLYADDAGDAAPAERRPWAATAEILARHASHRLEVLTVAHTAAAGRMQGGRRSTGNRPSEPPAVADEKREESSARRYARLLISEIKLYNEAAVEQGRRDRDLLGRLGHDIERARRLYEEKIPAAVRQRVDCFDEEVVRTLAGGDAGLLGHTR